MKIIEALKKFKLMERKLDDLTAKVRGNVAMMDYQESQYKDPKKQLQSWIDCHKDTLDEYSRLQIAINRTNLETKVSVELRPGKVVVKTIAEWLLRRRKLNQWEVHMWKQIRDTLMPTPVKDMGKDGEPRIAQVIRFYDVEERDAKVLELNEECTRIDGALEIVNAVTDLIE